MRRNIGAIDRIIRICVFVLALYLGYSIHWGFYIFAAWEMFTILSGWCFVYDWLKFNTIGNKK